MGNSPHFPVHESQCGYRPPSVKAEHCGCREGCTMKAQSHAAAAWELSLGDEAVSLTVRTDSLHYTIPPPWEETTRIHPDTKRRGSAALASSPTCLQVERDPRLIDVRRVALGADPPDRSAVYLLFRGRRHVPPAGQRPLATGATARDSAPQQPLVHPRGQAV